MADPNDTDRLSDEELRAIFHQSGLRGIEAAVREPLERRIAALEGVIAGTARISALEAALREALSHLRDGHPVDAVYSIRDALEGGTDG